jgi:dipeptidyl aminopeptidase/acylaminoacyl peptidase
MFHVRALPLVAGFLLVLVNPTRAELPLYKVRGAGPMMALAFSPDGKILASGDGAGVVHLTDAATGKALRQLENQGEVVALAFAPDGKTLAVKTRRGPISLWEITTGKIERTSATHNNGCNCLAFSADGTSILSAGPEECELWEPTRGRMSSTRHGSVPPSTLAAAAPDGQTAAWGRSDGRIQFFRMRGGVNQTLQAGPLASMSYAPDGKHLATGNTDKSIRLWDVATLKEVRRFQPARGAADGLAFSGDGKRLASFSNKEPALRIWDVATGKEIRAIDGARAPVLALALSPDGKRLATGSADGRVRLWDLAAPVSAIAPSSVPLTAKEMETLYGDLTNADPVKSRQAFGTLLANPKQSVPFLRERVRTAALIPPNPMISKYLADLDADEFEVRERASQELEKLGEAAAPALRQLLAEEPSTEVRQRIGRLLARLKKPSALPPEKVAALEAVEVLEELATPEAREALASLAKESLDAPVLKEIRAASGRAVARKPPVTSRPR